MSAIETLAVPASLQVGGSRYRNLRGKSVSETRSGVQKALLKAEEPHFSPPKSSVRVKRRSRSVAEILQPGTSSFAFSTPPVPPLPLAEKLEQLRTSKSGGNDAWKAYTPVRGSPAGVVEEGDATGPLSHGSSATPRTGVSSPISGVGQQQQQPQQEQDQEAQFQKEQRRRREEEEAALWADEVARLEAETDRILAEQRRKDAARIQAQLAQQSQLVPPPSPSSPLSPMSIMSIKPRSPVLEKFSFLGRGRRSNAATLSPTSSVYNSVDLTRTSSREPSLSPRSFVESPAFGKGFAPEIDLPLPSPLAHMSNSSDRTAIVRCRGISMDIVINIDTTTVDVLALCSIQVAHPIDTATSMLVEVYTQLGLERRLRRYERIREVMNSWDQDTQNSLIVLPDASESDKDLELSNVPQSEKPPRGFVLPLYHSQRPGKWHKRYVTLLDGGQMFLSKKADPNPTDKDVVSLCHLSDCDIYTPTETQMKKHLKAPKKYCYAIKSQEKTAVFVNTENFVHFFCTEDSNIAREFHSLVHGWRSWFLVNKMLQLQKKREEDPAPQIVPVKHKPKKSVSHVKINGHRLKVSVDEAPYSIGEFSPLLDLDRFNKPLGEFGEDWELDTSRRSALPPVPALPKDLPQLNSATGKDGEAALSGNTAREEAGQTQNGQKIAGETRGNSEDPSLSNDSRPATATSTSQALAAKKVTEPEKPAQPARPEPAGWFPSAAEHSARERSASVVRPSTSAGPPSSHEREQQQRRGRPSPLGNPMPKFVEPPQRPRKGLGRAVDMPEALLLVDMITGPSDSSSANHFLAVPPRNAMRRNTGDKNSGNTASSTSSSASRGPSSPLSQQRPSTSDGRPSAPRSRSAISGIGGSNRMGGTKAPPLPPVPPIPAPLRTGSHDRTREHDRDVMAGFPVPPRPSALSSSHSGIQQGGKVEPRRGRDPRPREPLREPPQNMHGRSGSARH